MNNVRMHAGWHRSRLRDGLHIEGAAGDVGAVQHDRDAVGTDLRPRHTDLVRGAGPRHHSRHVPSAPRRPCVPHKRFQP